MTLKTIQITFPSLFITNLGYPTFLGHDFDSYKCVQNNRLVDQMQTTLRYMKLNADQAC